MTTTDDGRQAMDEGEPGRRDVVKLIAAASLAAVGLGAPQIARASELADAALRSQDPQYRPVFFSGDEWPMVRSLADLVIPRDARSGSASDAGVPEFMDFIMNDNPKSQKWMRDGLKWMNAETDKRFGRSWVKCSVAQQRLVLNDIAFPKKAPAALKPGVEFFTRFRDLTSSGFWSSRIGVTDLGYMGNRPIAEWTGCPEPVLKKIGVSYKTSMHVPRR
jgi:hypothetical protein